MNCHKNNNSKNKSHGALKHMILMVLCCGLPILLVAALPFFKFASPAIRTSLAGIAPFICPLMMIFMLPMMIKGMRGEHSHCEQRENNNLSKNKIEE